MKPSPGTALHRAARALRCGAAALILAGECAALAVPGRFAAAQDLERERRLESEIVDMILDGEPIHLDADGHSFLAIHTEAGDGGPRKAVIVLHGRGFHPDWPEVARPLRTELPGHGWDTLSLQMPVLGKSARYYDYVPILHAAFPRIRAGIDVSPRERSAPRGHRRAQLQRPHGDGVRAPARRRGIRRVHRHRHGRDGLRSADARAASARGDVGPGPRSVRRRGLSGGAGRGVRPSRGDSGGGQSALRPAGRPRRRPLLPRQRRGARRTQVAQWLATLHDDG